VMDADMPTYWDTNGIIDEALSVLLLRHDRPGMLAVAKIDARAIMLPNPPLPGRPSDQEMARDTARVTEEKHYDILDYGGQHLGSADYFVVATFADAWAAPRRLRVTDPARAKLPNPDEAQLAPAEGFNEAPPSARGVVARITELAGHTSVVGTFRIGVDGAGRTAPFLSIVIAHLRTRGGRFERQLRLPTARENGDVVGGFSVPLSMLRPGVEELAPGFYALFAFVGNEAAPVRVFKVE